MNRKLIIDLLYEISALFVLLFIIFINKKPVITIYILVLLIPIIIWFSQDVSKIIEEKIRGVKNG